MHEVDDADQATGFLGLDLAGDRQLALDKVPLAKALNQKLRGFLATSGAKIFNMTQRFDGGYVQVSSYNGIERAFIYAEPTLPLEPDDLATAQILSGVTKDSDIIEVEDLMTRFQLWKRYVISSQLTRLGSTSTKKTQTNQ